ncbi:unnamed protein product [Mesocestoides corti]|uniref:Fido domain-containing protein n=1 Tax=Mesocestoides corti TaxID=53468 RepID=A0A0R3URC9_MESCO|nr:unnamed protein product [Mesocestoides corti]
MERFLRYEEPSSRSRMGMRNLAVAARHIATMSGCSEDIPYAQLLEELFKLFTVDAESILQQRFSWRYRPGERIVDYMAGIHYLVRRGYPGLTQEGFAVANFLWRLPGNLLPDQLPTYIRLS